MKTSCSCFSSFLRNGDNGYTLVKLMKRGTVVVHSQISDVKLAL